MNKLNLIDIYAAALAHYGEESQMDKLIEEMAELTQAILKVRRYPDNVHKLDNLVEEFADVKIVMAQIETLFDTKKVNFYMQDKLAKLQFNILNELRTKYNQNK